ncbi:hypothetical protein GCM10018790_77620 [Kitasatospora xanthocidica]|uniref:hypothetical protein n=1 Tax=Kitasatospora xanthocidica TaxID=83382 RepID=UPI001679EAB3|nr:hypothetical protein [Kitasatospora xanthocidica]GHF88666.1 hypothetical protein GCM10018790_77620 [Kitasatospora xanthocidica]
MTADRTTLNTRLLRRALTLYPASYGTHGLAELADHAERRVRAARPMAGLREVADVAGHGARVRLGLVSHRPMGRALATAAPLAAVLAGTYAAWHLWYTVQLVLGPGAEELGPSDARAVAVTALAVTPAALMAVAVLAGRWTAARALALVTVVATPLLATLHSTELRDSQTVLLAFNALVLLVAPPDRTSHPRSVAPWAVAVSITVAEVTLTLADGYFGERAAHTGFDFAAPVAVGVAIACTARTVGRAALATVVLAGPPLLWPVLVDVQADALPFVLRPVVLFAAGYAIAFAAVRLSDRSAHRADPQHP